MVGTKEPIAIVGSACRLPGGSSSPSKLWALLQHPRDILSEFPRDRLNLSSFHKANGEHHGSTDVQNKSYILSEDPRFFDASFFNINPREADGIDPQQRLLLETCYEALESAGCTLDQIRGSLTSVFVGSMTNDYYDIQFRDTETMPTYSITGTARSFLSNRVSYFFDLKGESMTIDTACSSSLVALHQAVQSLRNGLSNTSIVAGSNILLDPGTYIGESKLHMLSPDNHSKMWDKSANGYARGEGVAAVFLKPLSHALRDGDCIDCLVRETYVNSDGRTKGITMPSATAQAALIRRTYQNAGLDPLVDRCQYFECHGTGTQAGDPQEAQAIQEAFFPKTNKQERANEKLYVGSIKTVLGHTEGCAGLAGVLKASLAIQNRTIPPNMHFKELSPAVAPYYGNLQLVTNPTPWPKTLGTPARASVNSFGLGGTNAHAILEAYQPEAQKASPNVQSLESDPEERFVGPLTFSAKTKTSLNATIKDFASFIKLNPHVDLRALTHTLSSKRNEYKIRTFFSGATRQRLLYFMDKYTETPEAGGIDAAPHLRKNHPEEVPGTLGIFTGQGAQWASMGRQLIIGSPLFCKSIEECESSLATLPDPPSWSLKQELMAGKDTSRVAEAAISQPLCTAVQVALVDLLAAAGVKLDAVVGHSSGEIAATYAAGIISARDAIRIAYYRGYHAKLAQGLTGESGAMMAVGLSMDGAVSFCSRPSLYGRISVAASNAPTIVTLSGDSDAMNEAKAVLDEERTFARLLNVDTAYHSHHMLPCAEPYLDSLRACEIKVSAPRGDCIWISSVRGDVDLLDGDLHTLSGPYWVDNMVKPVLFSQAVECSLWNGGPYDLAVEIGPHPALKGPAMQTIKPATGYSLPYVGALKRGDDDVEAFSSAIGYVWSNLGKSFVNFEGYRKAFEGPDSTEPEMLKGLPSYAWDHEKIHWVESRLTRNHRLNAEISQELLGRRLHDDSKNESRWRNFLKLNELPWLRGHEFQGQTLFPAAGYIAMALEASRKITDQRTIKLVEVHDYTILGPLVIDDNSSGVETIFSVRIPHDNLQAQQDTIVQAEFDCYACHDASSGSLTKKCVGKLLIHLGNGSSNELPSRIPGPSGVLPVDMERFTSSIKNVGLNYQGLFTGIKSLKRTMGHATGSASWSDADLGQDYLVHPAFLDSGFQSLFAAFGSPSSGALWTTYLPVSIRRITVNPNVDFCCPLGEVKFDVDAFITETTFNSLSGDIHLFDTNGNAGVQVEGLVMKSISEPQASNDRLLFSETVWEADISHGLEGLEEPQDLGGKDLSEERGPDFLDGYVARVARRITYKYPQAKILEIGAGSRNITTCVLDMVKNAYSSYEKAGEEFANSYRKLSFPTLDMGKNITDQGFAPNSYDIVIASNASHEVPSLNDKLGRTRTLLKPGGYLIVSNLTAGLSPMEWDDLLQANAFSGVDNIVHNSPESSKDCCSVIVSQATDDQFNLIRDPLASIDSISMDEHLLIIGGRTLPIAKLIREAEKLLSPWKKQITIVKSLDDLSQEHLATRSSVISLTELDKPLFADSITTARLEILQTLFSQASNVLWTTTGRMSNNPLSNMTVGIGRALLSEMPHLNLQFIDSTKAALPSSRTVVEAFLRLILHKSQEFSKYNMLWITEPEIALDGDEVLIPRIVLDKTRNDRFNATRRLVTHEVDPRSDPVVVSSFKESLVLRAHDDINDRHSIPGHVRIDTAYSISLPSKAQETFVLCVGTKHGTNEKILAVSQSHSSSIEVPSNKTILVSSAHQTLGPENLKAIASRLVTNVLLPTLPTRCSVLFHEPDESLAAALRKDIRWQQREIYFSSSKQSPLPEAWIRVHPLISDRALKDVLPSNIRYIVDFSSFDDRTATLLKENRSVQYFDPKYLMDDCQELLSDAYHAIEQEHGSQPHMPNIENIIAAQDLAGASAASKSYPTIVDWTQSDYLNVAVQPLEPSVLFSRTKTYFLVGLTGELGRSLCRYMVNYGARYFALASRSAELDRLWLEEMQKKGATIKVFKMDVTNKDSVRATHATISDTMPPIAGVCNGALVLEDKLFVNNTADAMNKSLGPKVTGSKHLDEIFADPSLDFFILFSSATSVVGNGGQSNYHAANLFMTSLVAQRRSKGLAASVMSIGMVADIGVVQRAGRTIEDHLRKLFYLPLSESDVHYLFAEAVLASPPNSKRTSDIIMGIELFKGNADSKVKPPWYTNPRFSHLVLGSDESEEQTQASSSTLPVKQQLESAESEESATAILQDSFSMKLIAMLQITSGTINCNTSLLELGCDSLLAVEIRTWFLKEIQVDIPMLKIIGGSSVAEICHDAARKYIASKPVQSQDEPAVAEVTPPKDENVPQETSESAQLDESDSSQASDTDSQLNVEDINWISTITTPNNEPVMALDSNLGDFSYEHFKRVEKMSYAQSRMWFVGNYMKDPTAFNVTISYDISGELQPRRFYRALETVVSHHESLQTCFFSKPDAGELMQGVLTLPPRDYFKHVEASGEEEIKREFDALNNKVWRLEHGQSFGVTLITRGPELHTLIFGYHHIIMDGFSWYLLLRDLNSAYQLRLLEPVIKQYSDFTLEQTRSVEEGDLEDQLAFWKDAFLDLPDALPLLPFAQVKRRKALESYECHTARAIVGKDLVTKIKNAGQALRVTPFHFHLTVIQALLCSILDVEDICIGITDANRADDSIANTIGFFLNLLPLRFQVSKDDLFSDALKETSNKIISALANSKVPFDMLLNRLGVPRSSTHSPLFQVALNYRMGDVAQTVLGDCRLNLTSYVDAKSQFDLAFSVTQTAEGGSMLEITSLDHLYTPESTKLLLDMYVSLLESFSADTSLQIREGSLFDPSEAEQMTNIGRGARVSYELPATLSERFDNISEKYPGDIAIKDSFGEWSYAHLAKRANSIAAAILAKGLVPGSHVAVLCQPSMDTIACMLGILRIGCVYVPLDASLPRARHAAILATCEPSLILCQHSNWDSASGLSSASTAIVNITELRDDEAEAVQSRAQPNSPAFLLCTSGSTGTPKGMLLSQAGFANFLAAKADMLSRNDKEVVLQQSSYGFDMSITQTFYAIALGNGGTLAIAPQSARGDPVEIAKLMLQAKVTLTIATPSEYLMILRYGRESLDKYSSWRHACTGGESVTQQFKRELRLLNQPQVTLVDFYGPTEISAAAAMGIVSLDPDENNNSDAYTSVGKAVANTSIYILDEENNPVPVGYPGEICVGGTGVAIGYLDLPDLNRTKFLPDRFASHEEIAKGWTRMYKTGDRGKLQVDGSLIFMGRTGSDTQIKLRGLRIELDDVANTLIQASQGLLLDAIVTVRGDPEFLVAHVVIAQGKSPSDEELQLLAQNLPLPQYMCPAVITALERLPTTQNGKIDRKAVEILPLPARQFAPQAHKPLTLKQGELKLVWANVLKQPVTSLSIGPDSDFFMVGGNSLLLAKLQGAIKEQIGVSISLRDLYGVSTLARMAARIAAGREQQALEETSIAWDTETALPESLYLHKPQLQSQRQIKSYDREVLLTGSTTFLGSYILAELVKDNSVSKIHCIAVPEEGQTSLPQSDKIIAYTGRLLESNIGLAGDQCSMLEQSIDLIIHAGANGHCLNNYSSLKVPNFDSTKFLASLALHRKIPVHYISSNRVTLLSGSAALPPRSVAAFAPATDGSEGFTATKWASERYLESVARETGLPVCVHRACAVVGDKAPSEDALNALLRYSILMRAVPRFESFAGFFDFKDVGAVAGEIVGEATTRDSSSSSTSADIPSLRFRHHSCGKKVPVHELGTYMAELEGVVFETIALKEWLAKATELGIEDLIVTYLEAIVERGDTITFPYLGESTEEGA